MESKYFNLIHANSNDYEGKIFKETMQKIKWIVATVFEMLGKKWALSKTNGLPLEYRRVTEA